MGKIILQDGTETYNAMFDLEPFSAAMFGRNAHRGIANIIMTYAPGYDELNVTIAEGMKDKDFLDIRFKDYNGKNYFKRLAFGKSGFYGNEDCVITIDLKALKAKLEEVLKMKQDADIRDAKTKLNRTETELNRIRKVEAIKAELSPILTGWETDNETYKGHPQTWRKDGLAVKMDWNGGIEIDNVSIELIKRIVS